MAKLPNLGNIEDLLDVIKEERNILSATEIGVLRKEQPGSFEDNMALKVGARVFKKFELFDLRKIEKAYQTYSIIDKSSNAVPEAAVIAFRYVKRLAQKHVITGEHQRSIAIFVRSVGGQDVEIPLSQVERVNLPDRPVISIVSDVAYGTKLESLRHHGEVQGFLYHTSKVISREFGKALAVKFDYIYAPRLVESAKGGTLPRLQIANVGDLRGRSRKPGISGRGR